MQISIPVSWIFFPVTLPIKLVRLALAGVVGVVISPATFISCLEYDGPDTVVGYRRKYEVLSRETRLDSSIIRQKWLVRKIKVRPGLIGTIAGCRPKELELWTATNSNAKAFIAPNGLLADKRLVSGVDEVVATGRKKRDLEKIVAYNKEIMVEAKPE